jgi:hypothetical protein
MPEGAVTASTTLDDVDPKSCVMTTSEMRLHFYRLVADIVQMLGLAELLAGRSTLIPALLAPVSFFGRLHQSISRSLY